jgi:hypothetical protein
MLSLCRLSVLCVSVVSVSRSEFTTEAQSTQRSHRGLSLFSKDSGRVQTSLFPVVSRHGATTDYYLTALRLREERKKCDC